MLLTLAQANARIKRGAPLIIAGSRTALAKLHHGNWIGGSIPYFITKDGGTCDRAKVFVDEIKIPVTGWTIKSYAAPALVTMPADAFANGFSYVIMPANSRAHFAYAMNAPQYPDIFMKPFIGWISGVHLSELATETPVVVDGRTGTVLTDDAIVLHVELPAEKQTLVRTVNLFRPGSGPTVNFADAGFDAGTAMVDGQPVNLARVMKERAWDASLPLVADYAGTHVNVSIKSIDEATGRVSFYAPVFPGVDYRMAAPVGDYAEAFARLVPAGAAPLLSCNCILNYLYGGLEGRRTGPFCGPVTFGEIAHQLVNQTLVYLSAFDAAA